MIVIDGSVLEGGGQILRMALSCSALTCTAIKVTNIRARRQKGGLAAQHLKGLLLLQQMCHGRVCGASLGSKEIEFHPNTIKGGKFFADTQTAGSVALLLQVALPVTYFATSPTILELKGGTNAEMAPQIDFMTEILRPNIEKFGATFDFDLHMRGYFPKGGGHCVITSKPIKYLKPLELLNFGEVSKFFGWSFVAGTFPIEMAHEITDGAKHTIKDIGLNKPIDIETYKESADITIGNCSGIILGCKTTTNCIIGGSALGSKKDSCYDTGKKAALDIEEPISVKSCVDQHVQDQLIIFMALAKGKSRIRTTPLTLHTKTAIHVAELVTRAKFHIIKENSTVIIECDGIGLENRYF